MPNMGLPSAKDARTEDPGPADTDRGQKRPALATVDERLFMRLGSRSFLVRIVDTDPSWLDDPQHTLERIRLELR